MSAIELRRLPAGELRRSNWTAPPPPTAPAEPAAPVPAQSIPLRKDNAPPADPAEPQGIQQEQAPIIPLQSVAGRALLAVIAIMSFLAAITLGAAVMVRAGAEEWQGQVARELTIQVRPVEGVDMEGAVDRAAEIARATPGVARAQPYTRAQSARLLEPWLGAGFALDDLPVPRLVVVSVSAGARPDLDRLRLRLANEVAGASLDDHRAWVERMRSMSRAATLLGAGVLGLMLLATVLLVVFATRGAMAANRAIVEVLHFVGAKNRYIAAQFQRHFLRVGVKGAAMGGGAAILLFLLAHLLGGRIGPTAGEQALVSGLSLGIDGYAGILGVLVLVAAVAAMTSRLTVYRTLNALE